MAKSNRRPRVYLDSCVFIAWVKGETSAAQVEALLQMVDRGEAELLESVLVLGEVYKKSTETDPATRERADKKLDDLRANLESPDVMLLDVTPPIVRRATQYRQTYGMKLPDAIHLATAVLNGCDWLVTRDRGFPSKVDDLRIFDLDRLDGTTLPWVVPVQGDLFTVEGNLTLVPELFDTP